MLQCHKNLWHGRKDNALYGDIKRGTHRERKTLRWCRREGKGERKVRRD